MDNYYIIENSPGITPNINTQKYNYLENESIIEKLVSFNNGETSVVELFIPAMHCSSCIWVLENLNKLNKGVISSTVNFPKKNVRVTFKNNKLTLKELVHLITSIGYEPYISLDDDEGSAAKTNNTLIYQLAIAAFSFGNIMLLSFPEYFEVEEFWLEKYKHLFRWLMLVMAIPVVFYAAKNYFISAYKGLKNKILNIDVPIALGITVLFGRSSLEIITNTGSGFLDSLTGLVFFLLLGKFFQQKTYNFLSFERDYKSYFPIAVTKMVNGREKSIPVKEVVRGDRLLIRNEELIPVDGVLISGNAAIDYSFVTGESVAVIKNSGDKLFAGGKQTSGAIEMEVVNSISQSYLTQLWSHETFKKSNNVSIKTITDSISKYFTITLLTIALFAGIFWYNYNPHLAFNVVTAVLIIACPCALALAAPFAHGNILRIFGYQKFYVKNAEIIEEMANINIIIFDKTGTITTGNSSNLIYNGKKLNSTQLQAVKSILRTSNHPLSRQLYDFITENPLSDKLTFFEEKLGKGISATIRDMNIQIGSANYVGYKNKKLNETSIFIKIDNEILGSFVFKNKYREGAVSVFDKLIKKYQIIILSGDNEGEKNTLMKMLPKGLTYFFNQKPEDKLKFVQNLQQKGNRVMMIGDGLNDAGALAQSNVGIAVSENTNVFSPACDAIIDAKLFNNIPKFLTITHRTLSIIKASFVLSFLYNLIGMYFALTGQLTPIVAAILMPLSSISIVVFVTVLTNFFSKK